MPFSHIAPSHYSCLGLKSFPDEVSSTVHPWVPVACYYPLYPFLSFPLEFCSLQKRLVYFSCFLPSLHRSIRPVRAASTRSPWTQHPQHLQQCPAHRTLNEDMLKKHVMMAVVPGASLKCHFWAKCFTRIHSIPTAIAQGDVLSQLDTLEN